MLYICAILSMLAKTNTEARYLMKYEYQFPAMKKLDEWSFGEQITKVTFETSELVEALLCTEGNMDEILENVAKEAMDVIHSAETLLRILEKRHVKIDSIYEGTIEKNKKRHYYGE